MLVFRGLLAAIGVSQARDYDMNSQTVPRAAKEAIGAICRLTRGDASLTINVEYNQLDPMLRGGEVSGWREGGRGGREGRKILFYSCMALVPAIFSISIGRHLAR